VILVASRVAAVAAAVVGALALITTLLIGSTLASPPDYADARRPESVKPFDFGVDLPLSPEVGGFVALAAGLD
jgi:hypothetical protein